MTGLEKFLYLFIFLFNTIITNGIIIVIMTTIITIIIVTINYIILIVIIDVYNISILIVMLQFHLQNIIIYLQLYRFQFQLTVIFQALQSNIFEWKMMKSWITNLAQVIKKMLTVTWCNVY